MKKKNASIQERLNMLLMVCLIPLTVMILYLVIMMQRFSARYDKVVENITKANAYNIDFKEEMDYQMYIIVANSERAEELIDIDGPEKLISEARQVFNGLYNYYTTVLSGCQQVKMPFLCGFTKLQAK